MRAVIQRVSEASCQVDGQFTGQIGGGLLVLLGVEVGDSIDLVGKMTKKIANLRIFSDEQGQMNRSLLEMGGELLLISQFTLLADTRKGNRPSFIRAARPETAEPLYESAITHFQDLLGKPIATGIFGADMQIHLVNDGPVTILIDL